MICNPIDAHFMFMNLEMMGRTLNLLSENSGADMFIISLQLDWIYTASGFQAQYLEKTLFMSNYLLSSQGDRMGMANGIEGRFPFLDYRVMEMSARLRPELKLYGLTEKYLLKQAFGDELPAAIVRRPKQPYRAPIGKSFFADPQSALLDRTLGADAIASFGVLDAARVARLTARCGRTGGTAGEVDNMALAFTVSLQLLCEQFLARKCEPAPSPGAARVHEFAPDADG